MDLFRKPANVTTRWVSFENPRGKKGGGAILNRGAKGRPSDVLAPGKTFELLDQKGPGVVRRIWMTTTDPHVPRTMRSLRIEMYWDGSDKPAVEAPLSDFFGMGLGRKTAFESALFSDPEGRSFNCFVPMPFRRRARIVLVNESKKDITVFFDIDMTLGDALGDDALYFHAFWRRERPTRLGREFEILPKVRGAGRFLGSNIGLIEDPAYHGGWFGEGEVKAYLDGDGGRPTLCGTGTEDYIGTAWGQDKFAHRTQGCPIHDRDAKAWSFYRYHIDDPVLFEKDCRVTIQNMGGAGWGALRRMIERGAKVLPAVVVPSGKRPVNLLDRRGARSKRWNDDVWCNYFRQDDLSATAYFYLDRPASTLPRIQKLADRLAGT
jgi:hypothetical protein